MDVFAGKLDRRIRIETQTVTKDSYGGEVKTWTELATVSASAWPVRGNEAFLANQFMEGVQMQFRIRYRSDFDISARIVYGGKAYNIQHIAEIGRREGMQIFAKLP